MVTYDTIEFAEFLARYAGNETETEYTECVLDESNNIVFREVEKGENGKENRIKTSKIVLRALYDEV